jgi:hypothetical protein
MSAPMVRAILDGSKTQTRRLLRSEWLRCLDPDDEDDMPNILAGCPYGAPGARLWVRETWAGDDLNGYVYRADHPTAGLDAGDLDDGEQQIRRWRPSIFLPRPASRITLDVRGVRVERLHDITNTDAMAEGIPQTAGEATRAGLFDNAATPGHEWDNRTSAENFARLWDTINGKRAPWASNPWVWVVNFARAVPS